jgi:RHS repeat-associated protein
VNEASLPASRYEAERPPLPKTLHSILHAPEVADGHEALLAYDHALGAVAGAVGVGDSCGFAGSCTDSLTGLVYLRAREYDPQTGQFLTVDPAVDRTLQPYAYAANDPLSNTDPTGLDCADQFWGDVSAFAFGALDGFTMGGSSLLLGAKLDGYNEFIQAHQGAFDAGVTTEFAAELLTGLVTFGIGTGLALAKSGVRLAIKESVHMGFSQAKRVFTSGITKSALVRNLRWGTGLRKGTAKVPPSWGIGVPNAKKVGRRWEDPINQGNGVRIDKSGPGSPFLSQQVDHVIVRSGGVVIGRDGRGIIGSIKSDAANAHIPLDEWLLWKTWNKP